MNFDIDLAIITAFLVVNICAGIYYGRGIKTIKEYAIGNRNFSTGTIATTLIATWAGGGLFSIVISKTYTEGFYYLIPSISNALSFFMVAYFFAPRMVEFLDQLSVAEVMGNLYGKTVRIITAIAGLFGAIGSVAVQFKVLSSILSYFFVINNSVAILASSFIVITYATFGGIKAVTFTDIIQFFTFGTFIPILALTIWGSFDNPVIIFEVIKQNRIFNLNEIFNYHSPKFWSSFALFLYFSIPGLGPVFFQRVLMAKNTQQIYKSFYIAGFCSLLIILLLGWISILILSTKQGLDPNSIYSYIIDNYAYVGFKGFIIVGIMAMVMSTADSYINTSAVLFAHDFCKLFNIKWVERNELLLSRICSLIIGIFAVFLALSTQDLLELILFKASFYAPIVSVPLIFAIFGFRSTEKSVLIAMSAGVITVIIWRVFLSHTGINTVIPGMIANLIFLLGSHYLLKQPGGWVGIKDPKPLIAIRLERKRKFRKLLKSIKEFNILDFCRSNLPQNEITYSFFGFFIIASTYSSLYTVDEAIRVHYHEIYNFIYHSVLIISTGFLTYPIWPPTFKNKKFIAIAWNLGIFYLLICVGSMLVIINKFNALQLMVFMLNLMITCILLRWQAVLFITISGIFISAQFFKYYMSEHLVGNSDDIQFQIIYVLLLFSSALIVFLKPKQQSQEISEFIKNCLDDDNKQKQFELIKLSQYREEFVNRLDKYCIGVFKSIYQQITNLDKQLQNNDIEISSDKEQMINIIDRLKAGAEYLNQVILQVKDLVKIHPVKVNFEQFIYDIIDEYKNTNSHHDLEIILDFKTNIKEIEIDPQLIKNTLLTCINHGVTNSNISNVLISVCDTELEYDVNSPLKIKRDAVTLSIMVDNVTLTQQEISLVLQPTFNSINELNFTEIHKIITAHYGKINISLNNFGQVIYLITIPSRLREIRPKKMGLVDKQLDEVKAQNIQIISKNNSIVCDIAKQLIEIGMALPTVARITKLTLEELQQLETKG